MGITLSVVGNEFRSKWIEALRSGNYDQTTGNLFGDAERTHDGGDPYAGVDRFNEDGEYQEKPGHCCLGVAIDIQGGDTWSYNQDGEMPSREFLAMIGITYEQAEALATANDSGKSFDQIASEIERIEFNPYLLDAGDEVD